jgi:hypothetical protein
MPEKEDRKVKMGISLIRLPWLPPNILKQDSYMPKKKGNCDWPPVTTGGEELRYQTSNFIVSPPSHDKDLTP